MTPREIGHVLQSLHARQVRPPDRAALEELMQTYPDATKR
jgi:hypothetical protein